MDMQDLGWGFGNKVRDNFSTWELQVKAFVITSNMIRERFGDIPKMLIELHPMSYNLVSPKQKQGRMSTPYCRASLKKPLLVFTLIVLSP